MKKVTLAAPVEGGQPGDVVEVTDDRADWLTRSGYALNDANDPEYGLTRQAAPPEHDARRPENRDKAETPAPKQAASEQAAPKPAAAKKAAPPKKG